MFRKECIIAMKAKYRIVAGVILCALLVTQLLVPVYAVENETAAAGSCSVVSSNYVIEAGSITEQVILYGVWSFMRICRFIFCIDKMAHL